MQLGLKISTAIGLIAFNSITLLEQLFIYQSVFMSLISLMGLYFALSTLMSVYYGFPSHLSYVDDKRRSVSHILMFSFNWPIYIRKYARWAKLGNPDNPLGLYLYERLAVNRTNTSKQAIKAEVGMLIDYKHPHMKAHIDHLRSDQFVRKTYPDMFRHEIGDKYGDLTCIGFTEEKGVLFKKVICSCCGKTLLCPPTMHMQGGITKCELLIDKQLLISESFEA